VQRTRASIGYVEYAYAQPYRLSDMRDTSGAFIPADEDAFAAALASAGNESPMNEATLLLTHTGRGWLIAGVSFVLVPIAAHDADIQRATIDFFCWTLGDGQSLAREMRYVPIPAELAVRITTELRAHRP
jgi:phosphate transport system substrate-binding protein